MHTVQRIYFLLILIVFGAGLEGCTRHIMSPGQTSPKALFRLTVNRMLNDRTLNGSVLGIVAYSITTGDTLFQENSDLLLVPASNMKLITSAAALQLLGTDYVYTTALATNGSIDSQGTLHGNLYIIGSGDPTFSGLSFSSNPLSIFNSWADSLKSMKINCITGDVVGLDTCFANDPYGEGWELDDLAYPFAAPASGLCFFENCVNVAIVSGKGVGTPGRISLWPPNESVKINNYTRTTISSHNRPVISFKMEPNTKNIAINGTIPLYSKQFQYQTPVNNPAAYAAGVFYNLLLRRNIKVRGNPCTFDEVNANNNTENDQQKQLAITQQRILMTHQSPPLKEILNLMNKSSINLFAEQVLRTMGGHIKGEGSLKGGREAIQQFLTATGIDSGSTYIADGSGLSRLNLFSAGQIVRVLSFMAKQPTFADYQMSLAMPGEDGTLKNRFIDNPASGNLKAKTGTLKHVKALSGYISTRDGELCAFSIVVNNFTRGPWFIIKFQENFCSLLAQFNWRPRTNIDTVIQKPLSDINGVVSNHVNN